MTEKYVSPTGGGLHDGSSGANAWTLAEMDAATISPGDRVNIISGAYSSSGLSLTDAGSYNSRIIYRGYNSTIGDLDSPSRSASGALVITNFPVITMTGQITPANYTIFQNLVFTGAYIGILFNGGTPDSWGIINCKVTNSANNSSAWAINMDNNCFVLDSDILCTGASHSNVLALDSSGVVTGCRIEGTDSSSTWLSCRGIQALTGCAFLGAGGTSVGLNIESTEVSVYVGNNTFYNFGTAIRYPNVAVSTSNPVIIRNNHYTDCATGIDNLYIATANIFVIEEGSRTRDNTNNRLGLGDSINVGEVTTDTGGAETDYVNAPAGDITLIAAAPAVDAGLGM